MKRAAVLIVAIWAAAPAAFGAVPEWLRQAAQVQVPANSDARSVVLFEEHVTTVKDNGEIYTVYREAMKVLRPQGREDATVKVAFDKETRLTWLKGWSITAEGHETELKEKDAIETALFSDSLYDDTRHKLLRIPAEVGTVFGYEYEQKRRPMVYQDSWYFQDDVPVVKARFELHLPAGWEYESYWANHASQEPQAMGPSAWAWQVENVPAVESEPEMPAYRAIASRMVLNYFPANAALKGRTHSTWQQVGTWYAGLTAGRTDSNPEIKAKALLLTANAATPIDKMRALATYVQRNIRYVAVEIGVGGFQPHLATEIFRNQYGDCKDKVTLLASMLHEVGIDSHYVLVRTERGVVRPEIPSALGFNHVIVAMQLPAGTQAPGLGAVVQDPALGSLLYFDPTDEYTAFGQLPSELQASYGLVVAQQGGELRQLPLFDPSANRLTRQAKLELLPDGTLRGEVEETRTGAMNASIRARLLAAKASERAQVLESLIAPFLLHFQLVSATVGNLEQYDRDLVLRYKFEAPNYAKVAGNLLLVRPRVLGEKSDDVLERKQRKYAVEFENVSDQVDTFDIALPAGYTVDELPEATNAKYDFGDYISQVQATGNTIHYTREYRVKTVSVGEPKFQDLKKFYRQIAADERNAAVLKRTF